MRILNARVVPLSGLMSIKAAYVMGLLSAILVLSIAGAGFWGWVGGLLFGPFVAVIAFGMVGALRD